MTDRDVSCEGIPTKELAELRSILMIVPSRLSAITEERASEKISPHRWSLKEELGHLIDSASNNHQRIVRARLEDRPALSDYNGDEWVNLHAYQKSEWQEIIFLWHALNKHLLRAVEGLSEEEWSLTCTVDGSQPLTINFIVQDYLKHLRSHLRHIGVDEDDL